MERSGENFRSASRRTAAMPFTPDFSVAEDLARHLDASDPLAAFRERFHLPRRPDGSPLIYFCGHSLGLMPRSARTLVLQELDAWAEHGVEGHFRGDAPWYSYHELVRDAGARLVGARPDEVVFMNGLTVNLHLMFATFYRPTAERFRILIDEPTFPSDRYAVASQIRHHDFSPECGVLTVEPRPEEVERILDEQDQTIAVVFLSGVNFLTGEWLDIPRLAEIAHRHDAVFGLDLAHAAGNVPLRLHDWNVDFAVWCSYKYLNGGPGAVAGCFVHSRHGHDLSLPRLAGWWGNDPATRFRMQLEPEFVPRPGADGWQLSNPPILSLAPLRASLALFDEAGMAALRAKSERLTGYLLDLLDTLPPGRCEVITPREPARRGCQVSLRIGDVPRQAQKALESAGVVCDFREPDVIRAAAVPLYNTFAEVWSFVRILAEL
jgi:kynureninase